MCIPLHIIEQEMLDAHIDREGAREIESIMHAKDPRLVNRAHLKTDRKVLVYYNSSKQNERNEWVYIYINYCGNSGGRRRTHQGCSIGG